jgi:N4-gp56 family major capsid protein
MAITAYGDVSPRIGVYAAVKMLKHAEPILILEKFSQARPMPANKGQQIKFRRPTPFTVSTVALSEGVTPSSQQMAYTDVTATLAQYGAWVQLTDVIADTHEDPVLNDSAMLCGEQAAETRELLNWGVLKAGTAVTYSNGAARNAVNTVMSIGDIRSVVRTLRAQRCKPITKILNGSVDIGTKPVEAGYIAFGHTDIEADLRGLTGFTPIAEYGSRQPLCEYESGTVENVRFVLSPLFAPIANGGGAKGNMVSTTGTSADVYQTVIMGQEAWGTVPLKGKDSITPMILNPNTPRGGDELGQRGSVAWKTWHTSVVLNQAWLNRIESAVTAL